MLKNNLKREMTKRKISANKLSKEMNIGVQTKKKFKVTLSIILGDIC